MGEALLRHHLDGRGADVCVSSAGFLIGGTSPPAQVVETLASRGIDISRHRSRQMCLPMLDATDLVVTMTGQQLIELVLMVPEVWSRAFQLRDLIRRAERVGARVPGQSFDSWLRTVGAGWCRAGTQRPDGRDDIADPFGRPPEVFERVLAELDDVLASLAGLI